MSFNIRISEEVLDKNLKFKENEKVDWSGKNLKEKSKSELVVDIAQELKIIPKDIFKYLKVSLGEEVKQDDVLAEKKSFMASQTFKSPVKAEVRGINHEAGTITLAVEDVVDVPFSMVAKFEKKDKQDLVFKVKSGVEIVLVNSVDQSFGGKCEYIEKSEQIDLEKCENKVIVTKNIEGMDMAKLNALGPVAFVSFEMNYNAAPTPCLMLENKAEWKNLFEKKYQYCLYLSGKKTVYFYNYD